MMGHLKHPAPLCRQMSNLCRLDTSRWPLKLNAMTLVCAALVTVSAPGLPHPPARTPNGDAILPSVWSDAGRRLRVSPVGVLTSERISPPLRNPGK